VVGPLYWLQRRFPGHVLSPGSSDGGSSDGGISDGGISDGGSSDGGSSDGLSVAVWRSVPLNRGKSSSALVEVAVMKASGAACGVALNGEALAKA